MIEQKDMIEQRGRIVRKPRLSLFFVGIKLGLAAVAVGAIPGVAIAQSLPANATLYASGLEAPRGLRFGPDGTLYVAEAGTGGSKSTEKSCEQVPPPVGPYLGGYTGRISKISRNGTRTTLASGFPSAQSAGGDLIGVADVAFLDGVLYAAVAGGGCSHGHTGLPSGIARVDVSNGHWQQIADVGAFLKAHPAQYVNAGDFEPDGTLYSLIAFGGKLLTVEPNHGQVLSISKTGDIKQVIDVSSSQGHIVPTSIASLRGQLFIGNLGLFPITPQSSRILALANDEETSLNVPGIPTSAFHVVNSKAGFTTVVAVSVGPDGLLYVLELSAAAGFPTPGEGKVVRLNSAGMIEDVVTGLVVPTGMTFGPDGALYISNFGAIPAGAAPAGSGQVLRVSVDPGT